MSEKLEEAPKGRNSLARRNAPGRRASRSEALKGRNNDAGIAPFQGLPMGDGGDLGRGPRLVNCALSGLFRHAL